MEKIFLWLEMLAKQSIYKFRQARPELFFAKKEARLAIKCQMKLQMNAKKTLKYSYFKTLEVEVVC